jgi:hypothetical protein
MDEDIGALKPPQPDELGKILGDRQQVEADPGKANSCDGGSRPKRRLDMSACTSEADESRNNQLFKPPIPLWRASEGNVYGVAHRRSDTGFRTGQQASVDNRREAQYASVDQIPGNEISERLRRDNDPCCLARRRLSFGRMQPAVFSELVCEHPEIVIAIKVVRHAALCAYSRKGAHERMMQSAHDEHGRGAGKRIVPRHMPQVAEPNIGFGAAA